MFKDMTMGEAWLRGYEAKKKKKLLKKQMLQKYERERAIQNQYAKAFKQQRLEIEELKDRISRDD